MSAKKNPGAAAGASARRKSAASGRRKSAPTQAACDPVYLLRLQGRGTRDDIRYLRLLLKMLGRAYGFRALSVEEERGRP